MAARTVKASLVIDGIEVGRAVKAGDLVGFDAGKLASAVGAAGAVVEARGVAVTHGRAGKFISIELRGEFGLPMAAIWGYGELTKFGNQTGCPGSYLISWCWRYRRGEV